MRNSEDLTRERVGKRISIIRLPDGFDARILSAKNTFMLIFLPIWLVLWSAGGLAALWSLISGKSGNDSFTAIWLCFWLLAEAFAIYTLLWQAVGHERITIRKGRLEISKVVFLPLWIKSIPIAQIRNLRASGQFDTVFSFNASLQYYGMTGGNIALRQRALPTDSNRTT